MVKSLTDKEARAVLYGGNLPSSPKYRPESARARDLWAQAARVDREAVKLDRRAAALAARGCVFSAGDLSELAAAHRRAAGELRVSAINHDADTFAASTQGRETEQ